ncbi:hypothetical protein [Mesorhizobium sp. M0898]|uniref:hypothetical protein n=1 Tax=Mesorhizobium sp. M0898 TaxID=2957020 RepID=UPI003336C977
MNDAVDPLPDEHVWLPEHAHGYASVRIVVRGSGDSDVEDEYVKHDSTPISRSLNGSPDKPGAAAVRVGSAPASRGAAGKAIITNYADDTLHGRKTLKLLAWLGNDYHGIAAPEGGPAIQYDQNV